MIKNIRCCNCQSDNVKKIYWRYNKSFTTVSFWYDKKAITENLVVRKDLLKSETKLIKIKKNNSRKYPENKVDKKIKDIIDKATEIERSWAELHYCLVCKNIIDLKHEIYANIDEFNDFLKKRKLLLKREETTNYTCSNCSSLIQKVDWGSNEPKSRLLKQLTSDSKSSTYIRPHLYECSQCGVIKYIRETKKGIFKVSGLPSENLTELIKRIKDQDIFSDITSSMERQKNQQTFSQAVDDVTTIFDVAEPFLDIGATIMGFFGDNE